MFQDAGIVWSASLTLGTIRRTVTGLSLDPAIGTASLLKELRLGFFSVLGRGVGGRLALGSGLLRGLRVIRRLKLLVKTLVIGEINLRNHPRLRPMEICVSWHP